MNIKTLPKLPGSKYERRSLSRYLKGLKILEYDKKGRRGHLREILDADTNIRRSLLYPLASTIIFGTIGSVSTYSSEISESINSIREGVEVTTGYDLSKLEILALPVIVGLIAPVYNVFKKIALNKKIKENKKLVHALRQATKTGEMPKGLERIALDKK